MIDEEKYDEDFIESINEDYSVQTSSQDSFGKGILKAYEEHKKTETKINQRPMSSYQINNNPQNNNKIFSKQKPQSANLISSFNNSNKSVSSKQEKECDKKYEEIIKDLSNFIDKNKIKKSDFIDNENIFLSFEDFKSLLQSIHYIIPKQYVKILFDYNNEGAKDNYISISKFVNKFYEESESDKSNKSLNDKSNNTSLNERPNSSKQIKINNNNIKSIYEIAFINNEFVKFNKDINDIIRKDGIRNFNNNISKINNKKSSFRKRPISGIPRSQNSSKINIDSKPITISKRSSLKSLNSKMNINEEEKYIEDYIKKEFNLEEKERQKKIKYNSKNIIKKREIEAKKEEEKIRKIFEKRKNDNRNEIFEKCVEMNKISEILNLPKRYKIISKNDELYCCFKRDKNDKKIGEMDIKNFEIEYRRLNKLYLQKDIKEKYSSQEPHIKKDLESLVKERQNEKNEKKKDIKEVLIEAVKLKNKLKSQLDNLKSKVKIEEKVVIEQLLKAGIEIEKKK
jgi:hypothetical protein